MSGARFVIVMGVTGSGKTTVGRRLAAELHWRFAEGDDFHPHANVRKMAAGHPLTDADRMPWLDAIGDWIDARADEGVSAVITCSALRRGYRDRLLNRAAAPYFCLLSASAEVIGERLKHRDGHFMPASLLPSQIATLEPLAPDEPGVTVSAEQPAERVVAAALRALRRKGATP